jgi:hypothetical protein
VVVVDLRAVDADKPAKDVMEGDWPVEEGTKRLAED